MVRDLKATLPLARMFTTEFPPYVDKRATYVTFVEVSTLFDVRTDHLATRSDEVDLQLWIAQGSEPLPRRVVITYKNSPGRAAVPRRPVRLEHRAEGRRCRVPVRSAGGCGASQLLAPLNHRHFDYPHWRPTMNRRPRLRGIPVALVSVAGLVVAVWADVDAAGRGGGGGGRGGAAAACRGAVPPAAAACLRGSCPSVPRSHRAARPRRSDPRRRTTSSADSRQGSQGQRQDDLDVNQDHRQDYRDDARGDRQDEADDVRDDRQDYYDDWDGGNSLRR